MIETLKWQRLNRVMLWRMNGGGGRYLNKVTWSMPASREKWVERGIDGE